MGEFRIGDVIEGGMDFSIRRIIEGRKARHLWRVRCVDGRGVYYFDFSTTELREMAKRFGLKRERGE